MQNLFKLTLTIFTLLLSLNVSAQIQQINLKPISTNDDAEERLSSGTVVLTSSDLELSGYDGSSQQVVGIRFPNVTLPIGASILNAYIQFSTDEANSVGAEVTIKAQRGNAAIYTSATNDITNRTYTGSSILWSTPSWPSIGERSANQQTPDLSGLISEAILGGFNSGDALAFTFTGSNPSGRATADSRNAGEITAPELVIEYSEQPIERTLLSDILVINEVAGSGTAANNNDWVELYNKSNDAINLDSVSVTDDINEPFKYVYSDRKINGRSFTLLETNIETNNFFGIKSTGETIYLYQTFNGETILLDSLAGMDTSAKISYGRKPDGSNSITEFLSSTPGSSNDLATEFIDLQFSQPRGLYTAAFNLSLSAPGATIRYTTNSTIPSASNGTIYNGPIPITNNTVVKAFAYSAIGQSKVITHTYIVSNEPGYQQIPISAISTTNSIASTTERGCTYEFINTYGENDSHYSDAGFKVYGNVSKGERKKNFRVLFKDIYGDNKFEHDIFEQEPGTNITPTNQFKALDLKTGQDATNSYGLGGTMMSEVTARKYARQMGNAEIHARYTHLFINGEYRGVYALRERFNHHWMEEYYGGEDEEYDVLDSGDTVNSFPDSPRALNGTTASWNFLKSVARTDFQALKSGLNVKQFIDYMLLYFVGDFESEWRAATDRDFDRAKMQLYHNDLDGFIRANTDVGLSSHKVKLNTSSGHGPGQLFWLANMGGSNLEYVTMVKDRVRVVFDETPGVGILSVNAMTKTTEEIRAIFRNVNHLEYDRWGYSDSLQFENRLSDYIAYLPTRIRDVKNFLNSRNLIHTHAPVSFSQPEGNITADTPVTISNPNAGTQVYYAIGGDDVVFDNAPSGTLYTPGTPLPLQEGYNIVKSRAYSNGNFGPLTEATYFVIPKLNITGINYHPDVDPALEEDNFEFLFLTNYNNIPRNIAGDTIKGIGYVFPDGAVIEAGETVMIAKSEEAYPSFTNRRFIWADGKLSNKGEKLTYIQSDSLVINALEYDDVAPWPIEADGTGYYLRLKQSNLDNSVAENWEAVLLPPATPFDCPATSSNIGDDCDDNNPNTINDVYNSNCTCEGTLKIDEKINITGINYNPSVDSLLNGDDFEFVYITNYGNTDVFVGGDSILGIGFVFPANEVITAGETVMLIKDPLVYPDVNFRKILWDGSKLSNGGEQLLFKKPNNGVINDLTYDDVLPWPVEADGAGFYLQLISPELDNTVAANWQALPMPLIYGECTDNGGDSDGDGICANVDCNDNDAAISFIGNPCDDGNAETENDVIVADCICAGTPIINEALNITGINYNPSVDSLLNGDDFEFVYITNYGNTDVFVGGDSILGIGFVFPANEVITAGETVMLIKDPLVYPDVNFRKILWDGSKLSNGGEQLLFKKPNNGVINDLTYDDVLPWPVEADGAGFYLQLISPELDNTVAANWQALPMPLIYGGCTDNGGDSDGDGICANVDCDDNDAAISFIGDPCDDGNAETENDVIVADCICAGTPIINEALNITGINYNPLITDTTLVDDNFEFLLITNYGDTDIFIGGDTILGIDFVFPDNVVIAAGETVMLTKILTNYPSLDFRRILWNSDGKLSNKGEQLVFKKPNNGVINNLEYDDKAPWPVEADGSGYYLQLKSADLDNTIATNWEAILLPAAVEDACAAFGGDMDGDGVCAVNDCDDNNPNISSEGDACDDNNPNTTDDIITADCSCAGTLIVIDNDGDNVPAALDCDDNDPSIPTTPGTPCDDNDSATENDVIGDDGCSCAGTLIVIDNDGDNIPAALDCDDNDPSIPTAPGTPCDDNDSTTENDMIGDDGCSCAGTLIIDNDGDNVPAALDCDDNDPSIPTAPGTPCDDNDSTTENDVIGDDGCSCAGTLIETPECHLVQYDFNNFDSAEIGFGIWNDPGSDCSIRTSPEGSPSIRLRDNSITSYTATNLLDFNGKTEAQIDFTYTPVSMENGEDFMLEYSLDGGVNFILVQSWVSGTDFQNNDSKIERVQIAVNFTPTTIFRFRCDATSNYDWVFLDDIRISTCSDSTGPLFDCPNLMANVNDPCDDGDVNTENDSVTTDCGCTGTQVMDCPDLNGNIGDPCDDGDANTENDTITQDCGCTGTQVMDCPDLNGNIGDPCDDGDVNTENDTITQDCGCAGTLVLSCPDLNGNIDDPCDDGDANTENDTITQDCGCAGSPIIPSDCTSSIYDNNDFESGLGIWIIGGGDAALYPGGTSGGSSTVRLRDNSGISSSIFTPILDFSDVEEVELAFMLRFRSMEFKEDLFLEYSINGGAEYITAQQWISGENIENASDYSAQTVTIIDDFTPETIIRFRADASSNYDFVFLDDIQISVCKNETATNNTPDIADNAKSAINLGAQKKSSTVELSISHNLTKEASFLTVEKLDERTASFESIEDIVVEHMDNTYTIVDNQVKEGDNVYRAKVFYVDGTQEETELEVVRFNANKLYNLFPNPTTDVLHVDMKEYIGTNVQISIYNLQGTEISRQQYDDLQQTQISFDLTNTNAGMYLIKVDSEGRRAISKMFSVIRP